MKEMGWSWEDLMEIPYERYLMTRRIVSIENKEEAKQVNKAESQAKNI